ncbi:MAG: transaldolase [Longimicrobiaceae bacterium]
MNTGTNPLQRLQQEGQSVWLDYISRGMLEDGSLERMMREYDLRGVTSNPAIFEQAITGSDDYGPALEALAGSGATPQEVYERLAVEDIQRAADIFRPLYQATGGGDGFVSLEVSPELAHDTDATVAEAGRLWSAVDRRNLMIKVPGTGAGTEAVERLIAGGVNVNVTLLFSSSVYERVMEAYLRGLEGLLHAGKDLSGVASVASFFVSRVDSAVDQELDQVARETEGERAEAARSLQGRIAVANARLAYARFREVFGGERFGALVKEGARVQRPLWASTSTKNPSYSDTLYVEALIGPDTVNTMPLDTLEAFFDHGVVRRTVDLDLADARRELAALEGLGVSLDQITARLQEEGVEKFAQPFRRLLQTIERKLERVAARA